MAHAITVRGELPSVTQTVTPGTGVVTVTAGEATPVTPVVYLCLANVGQLQINVTGQVILHITGACTNIAIYTAAEVYLCLNFSAQEATVNITHRDTYLTFYPPSRATKYVITGAAEVLYCDGLLPTCTVIRGKFNETIMSNPGGQ